MRIVQFRWSSVEIASAMALRGSAVFGSYSTSPVNNAERICPSRVVVALAGTRFSGSAAARMNSPPRTVPSAARTPAARSTPPPAAPAPSPITAMNPTVRHPVPNTRPPYAPLAVTWPTPEGGRSGALGQGAGGEAADPPAAVGGQSGLGGVGAARAMDAPAGVRRRGAEEEAPHRGLGPGHTRDRPEHQLLVNLGRAAVHGPADEVGVRRL